MKSLKDRVAVVTCTAAGIGLGTTGGPARGGARVVVADIDGTAAGTRR